MAAQIASPSAIAGPVSDFCRCKRWIDCACSPPVQVGAAGRDPGQGAPQRGGHAVSGRQGWAQQAWFAGRLISYALHSNICPGETQLVAVEVDPQPVAAVSVSKAGGKEGRPRPTSPDPRLPDAVSRGMERKASNGGPGFAVRKQCSVQPWAAGRDYGVCLSSRSTSSSASCEHSRAARHRNSRRRGAFEVCS
jgi:hypothetical protein